MFFNKLLCAFVLLAPFKMQSPGKGLSCSALRTVQDVSGYYLEEMANTFFQSGSDSLTEGRDCRPYTSVHPDHTP